MLTPDQLHPYQRRAVNHQCVHPNSMLWLDPGLGKTAVTLTTVEYLQRTGWLGSVLIVAPLRVCRLVWRQEALKWSHTAHLTFGMVMGTPDQRTRALMRPANIYLTNYENMKWIASTLTTYYIKKNKPTPFNGLVLDEISKCKNSSTNRVHSWFDARRNDNLLDHFIWTTGLTGTPAANGYKDLHGQYLMVDKGVRLGTSKTAFMTRWYKKDNYKDIAYKDTEESIKGLIADITMEMSAKDYIKMPDMITNDVMVELPTEFRAKYDQMEKDFFIKLDSGAEVESFNQASLTNRLLQFSNGAMYPVAGMPLWEPIHDAKLEALEDIVEEANGQPVLCFYAYRSDAERIMKKFHSLSPINMSECKTETSMSRAMLRWQTNDCQLMIAHPGCLAPDTQVLTERNGWVNLIDVGLMDRVFDGVEFVTHYGCSYSGYEEVIDVMGITMTPNHKLLIDGQWIEGRYVQDTEKVRAEAQNLQRQIDDCCTSPVPNVWSNFRNSSSECSKEQQGKPGALFRVHPDYFSSTYRYSSLENLEGDEVAEQGYFGQKLRWSWNRSLRGMVEFYKVLGRHARNLFERFDNRTDRCKQDVLQRELSMGVQYGATVQQAEQPLCLVSGGAITLGRTGTPQWIFKNNVNDATQSGDDWRRSSGELSEFQLQEESAKSGCETQRKSHVYDLVNCGPRTRFVVRNNKGEVFIAHNSAGHGLDGLQKTGSIVVWFGLNWSLELTLQANARLHRQGQGKPVVCHRILCKDTMDEAQSLALDEKATTQNSLRKAVKEYRERREKSS